MRTPNRLINESSPYLLQHAYNPVDWHPWGAEAWTKAREENKLVLISIGYSACHWCHVMERECFEDAEVAEVMNTHFINIKVDREERPDVDQIYMLAVQLMTGSGGWPLNCITLPDGRPVFGGTYFPRRRWLHVLQQLAEYYRSQPDDALAFAARITEALRKLEQPGTEATASLSLDIAQTLYQAWQPHLDRTEGGFDRSPKFALPNSLQFLLNYAVASGQAEPAEHVLLTLRKMAYGGIYDQIGGGFARYSTDARWHVPHFEKMLYDNAQLISLYAQAYRYKGDPLFRSIAEQTFQFVVRELTSANGALCAALDADSEGEEGRFYVWTLDELRHLLDADYDLAVHYFRLDDAAHWEEGKYILLRHADEQALADAFNCSLTELQLRLDRIRQRLLEVRNQRPRPQRDDKEITSWCALMISACCDAYDAWNDPNCYALALEQGQRNWEHFSSDPDLGFAHSRMNDKRTAPGFLEDYAFSAEAYLNLYRITFDETWIQRARALVQFADEHFYDAQRGTYYYTASSEQSLIVRMAELSDDVIPASGSAMARLLWRLGRLTDDTSLISRSERMLRSMLDHMNRYPMAYSNWANLLLEHVVPWQELVVAGPEALALRQELARHFLPFALLAGSTKASTLPLLQNRFVENQTLIYVCHNQVCQQPVHLAAEALRFLNITPASKE
ncbi:MAG: thioredoxin domain-containing protein [Chitinophagales bacterium]|nr:thioredoxin domain-containing protein [Chitinophagales bacterium]MDW8394318.1 thioredoxin domain-containing protein [Chitinophagales bacterium]